jgi:SAM-dependent methyltransferase
MKISSAASASNNRRWWIPNRHLQAELMDVDQPLDDFKKCFHDIRTINRLFGGLSLVLRHVSKLFEGGVSELSVLDVATGDADVPRAILRWGHQQGYQVSVTAIDSNSKVLRVAKEASQGVADLSFMEGDARSLSFPDDSFDCVLLSLTLHHFDDATAARVMQEMMRVARREIIINDLRRGYLPAALIWLVTRLMGMNRLTRNDAPLSVLRARTMGEYRDLVRQAGITSAHVYKHPFWRVAIVARKSR